MFCICDQGFLSCWLDASGVVLESSECVQDLCDLVSPFFFSSCSESRFRCDCWFVNKSVTYLVFADLVCLKIIPIVFFFFAILTYAWRLRRTFTRVAPPIDLPHIHCDWTMSWTFSSVFFLSGSLWIWLWNVCLWCCQPVCIMSVVSS